MGIIEIKQGERQIDIESGVSGIEIVEVFGERGRDDICAIEYGGRASDLRAPLNEDAEIRFLTFEDDYGKEAFWHTSSHIMAQALSRIFPGIQLAIGPSIESGFYYDVDSEHVFTPEDFEAIESEMRKIVEENLPLERFALSKEEAQELMGTQEYKRELIALLPEDEEISFYKQGEFTDLCAGPHLMSTGAVKAVKITGVTGAYWRGDSDNKMLQRLYGISFPDIKLLDAHMKMLEEAKRRDHRRLGKELDLFDIFPEGPGFPFFFPKGMVLRNMLEEFWREEHRKAGYDEIRTPIILSEDLWRRSGHWDHYLNNMYFTRIDDGNYAVKPMNCSGGMLAYKRKKHSYRDLPQRMAEMGLVHRHELSGVLHGMMRVRCFTQDDAHIFMTPDQVEDELLGIIKLIDDFYKTFNFEYTVELSTRPEDFMGDVDTWNFAETTLENVLKLSGKEYKINPGDGAFYGPKIDFHLRDAIGRTWQCGTIQLDFQMPERFDLSYTGSDGLEHRPVMIHRVVFGAIERFIAILTEHFAGAFPVWLAPVQAIVIPISDNHHAYADEIFASLDAKGIRVENDKRNEKMGYKIREAQLQKIPYMLIVGDKESQSGNISLRSRRDGDLGAMPLEQFIADIEREIAEKEV
ncbi:MAG: threonine--tRNA ligase [Oscillospiraceae bacterium]|nr:threonine--tRNA ligase [Oscillospiraceae bacterium]